jgi:membrane protein
MVKAFLKPFNRTSAAISWSFFFSLFVFICFCLSILPYLPHYDKLQFYIFEVLMHNVFPAHMQADVSHYITKSIVPNMKSISNFTIVFALIFATNGTSLINGFNENTEEKKVMFMNIFCLFYYYWFYYYLFFAFRNLLF